MKFWHFPNQRSFSILSASCEGLGCNTRGMRITPAPVFSAPKVHLPRKAIAVRNSAVQGCLQRRDNDELAHRQVELDQVYDRYIGRQVKTKTEGTGKKVEMQSVAAHDHSVQAAIAAM
jgi:hypothetical protein